MSFLRTGGGVLAVLALAAAGCGGGATTGAEAPLTKAQWILKADSICSRGGAETQAAAAKQFSGKQPSAKDQVGFISDTVLPAVQDEIDQIRQLPAPTGDESRVKAILDAAQRGIDAGKKDPAALSDPSKPQAFAEANKLATAYGMKVCGSSAGG